MSSARGRGGGDRFSGRGGSRGPGGGRDFGRGRDGARGPREFAPGGGRGGEGRGGGRGGGRGRGDFDDCPPPTFGPDREAPLGSAARPGQQLTLMSVASSAAQVEATFDGFSKGIQATGLQPRPKRPGFGKAAHRTLQLVANHFPVSCKLEQAFHYDVTVSSMRRTDPEKEMENLDISDKERAPRGPEKPLTSELSRRVVKALAEQERWPSVWAYDGRRNIYAAKLFLPQHESVFKVETTDGESDRQRLFKVSIKWVQTISITALLTFVRGQNGEEIPQDAVQALDIALKHSVSYRDDVKTFARAIFWHDPTKVKPLGNGAEVWLGYQQSLRPSQAGLTLNMGMAATAFLEHQPVMDYLMRAVGLRNPRDFARLTPHQLRTASKAITGIKVEVRLGGAFSRKYRAKGLMPKGPAELTFHNEQEGRDMTVAEYYEMHYHISVEFPEVPCINVGTPTKPVWLPPEVCWIAPGQRRLKLDEKQTAEMIKTAAQKPGERKEYLQKCLRDFADLPNDPVVKSFGMTVDPSFLKVTGRQLPAPELQYKSRKIVPQPDKGSWDMIDTGFFQPGAITSFAIACFCSQRSAGGPKEDRASLQNFMSDLLSGCRKAGIQVPGPGLVPEPLIVWHNSSSIFPGDTMAAAFEAAKSFFKKDPDILFVILPERGATEVYKAVKRASDSHLGVPSQCFNPQKGGISIPPRKPRDQYIGNVVMKINAKLSGVNVSLISRPVPWMNEPFMILGADVTHPVGFNQSSPSVAAVVGSLDRHLSIFGARILLQPHCVEIIMELKEAAKKLMIEFYKRTRHKPKRLIMYRDGVSEGQYPQVQRYEIPQLVQAICELNNCDIKDCGIPITYMVVSKGHHTRLFPATPRDGDRNGNVFPGTVVDKGIVHPTEYDFYLNAHASIQGTSRPVHYHVLLDQNRLGPDQLHSLTYDMCYLFCRCTRSVSIVPPCYYAHLAAFRGRILVTESLSDTESSVSGGTAGPANVEYAEMHTNLFNKMFYV